MAVKPVGFVCTGTISRVIVKVTFFFFFFGRNKRYIEQCEPVKVTTTGTAIFQPPALRHRLPQKLEAEVSHRLGRAASRPCRRASRVAHLNNHIIPMLLVFLLLFLKVVLSDLQFSQGVVFFC